MKRTKENVQAFYQQARKRWTEAKELSKQDEIKTAWEEAKRTLSASFSLTAFCYVKKQMEDMGLVGTPYIDIKTFKGWQESGFTVKKGETSKISGMAFLEVEDKGKVKRILPKIYSLFHIPQVEKITV